MERQSWLISREIIEEQLGRPLTEDQWNWLADEIAGRVDNFIEEILDNEIERAIELNPEGGE